MIIDMSRHRGYFVDQSQSLNLFMQNANYSKLTSMHFLCLAIENWNVLLENKAAVDAIKFTLNNDKKEPIEVKSKAATTVAAAEAVAGASSNKREEYRAMIELAKNAVQTIAKCVTLITK
jgi:ribonucleoside-diphosphate reductase alpha chain